MTQVQAGAGADHHRRRRELDRDLAGIMAAILGVEVSRTADSINQAEGAAEAKAAAAQAARAEAAAAADVAAAAIFHLLIRRPFNRTPAVHHVTHFLPATFPTATRLHLLTAGVFRVGRLHLTSGMRSRTATNLQTTQEAAAATRARALLKEGTTMVISPEAANFTSGRPAAAAMPRLATTCLLYTSPSPRDS